jgi:HPt (histidine-containing phosphotransfer) domain-containing protein
MSEVDALLAAARAEYASRLPSKLAAIEELAARGAWDEARRAAHKLRGSAATYGFAAVGDAAATLEKLTAEATSGVAPAEGAVDEALRQARIEVGRFGELEGSMRLPSNVTDGSAR